MLELTPQVGLAKEDMFTSCFLKCFSSGNAIAAELMPLFVHPLLLPVLSSLNSSVLSQLASIV